MRLRRTRERLQPLLSKYKPDKDGRHAQIVQADPNSMNTQNAELCCIRHRLQNASSAPGCVVRHP